MIVALVERSVNLISSKKQRTHFFIILSFIFISLLCFILLISTHIFYGSIDSAFHLKRILELRQSLVHGILFPAFSFNNFHGSIVMSLYPYINLFPISILSIFISSKLILYYTWLVFNEFLTLIISFYSSYSINKSKRISYLFSLTYGSSILFLGFGQGLSDLGILTSCAILPLVIFGSVKLVKNGKYIELSLGMTLIIYCHILNSIIASIFVISWLIININELNIKKYIALFKSFLLTVLLTSLVWIHFVYYLFFIKTKIAVPAPATSAKELVNDSGGILQLLRDITNRLSATMSILSIIGLIISIIFYKHLSKTLKKMLCLSIFVLILCSDIFPWNYIPHFIFKFFGAFQGIARFSILPQLLLSYLFSAIIVDIIGKYYSLHILNLVTLGIIIILALLQIDIQINVIHQWAKYPIVTKRYVHSNFHEYLMNRLPHYKLKKSNNFKYLLNANYYPYHDYYPKSSIHDFLNINNNEAVYNHNRKINVRHVGYNQFSFNSPKYIKRLSLPLVYYKGEHVSVIKNHHLDNYCVNKHNLITLNNVKRGKNEITIKYKSNNLLSSIAYFTSLIGLLWIIGLLSKKLIEYMKFRKVNYLKSNN